MKFTGIQMLRFAAAMLVAAMHISQAMAVHLGSEGSRAYWTQGSAGVDIFFVISGFVMGLSTPPSAPHWRERIAQAWQFLQRRLIRVVPLYWFYTLLKVGLVAALPMLALRTHLDGTHLAASLVFVPWVSPWGLVEPVLPVGWTLNFEMLFYALFALAVLLGLPRMLTCLVVFGLLMLAARWQGDSALLNFWGSTIVLEFVLGVGLARLRQRGWTLPPEAGLLALCLGLVWMFALPWQVQDDRLLSWGLGAAMVVAGAIWLEPWAARLPAAGMLAFLGDASYSIYLSHTFVVPAAARAAAAADWAQDSANAPLFTALIALLIALLVVLGGCLSYVLLERPMTQGLARRLVRRRKSTDSLSTAPDRAAAAQPSINAP